MIKETIAKFISEYTGDDLSVDLAAYLLRLGAIKDKRQELNRQWRALVAAYEYTTKNWDQSERELQDSCPHPETNFCGDPCGGHDSYYQCSLCGKELR